VIFGPPGGREGAEIDTVAAEKAVESTGKYGLRPAVRKCYHLRLKLPASCVSVASRVVNPKREDLGPALSKELAQYFRESGIFYLCLVYKFQI
jgi:hypothetical protein